MSPLRMILMCVLLISICNFGCKDLGKNILGQTLTATSLSVTLNPGGNAIVTISGGNPPYTISRQPDPSLASATLTNNTNSTASLTIQAVSGSVSGTTNVKIKDSESHDQSIDGPLHDENEIEIEIRVTPVGTGVSFSAQVQPIFINKCVNEGCHPGSSAPFPLREGQSYGSLVNVQATSSCTSEKRVNPGSATSSVLYLKISGTTCGTRMPQGRAALSQAEMDIIKDWINQGALNN